VGWVPVNIREPSPISYRSSDPDAVGPLKSSFTQLTRRFLVFDLSLLADVFGNLLQRFSLVRSVRLQPDHGVRRRHPTVRLKADTTAL
jgi:hypothetical protein